MAKAKPKIREIYNVINAKSEVVFEGDFDEMQIYFFGLSRKTLEGYISQGHTNSGQQIKLVRCEGVMPPVEKAKSLFREDTLKEWEEVCKPFRELSARKKARA